MSEPALELFRKACGLGNPLALVCQDVKSPVGAYSPFEYHRPFMLIGRHPSSDLNLNNDQISRRHAYIQAVAGRVYCIDLGSRTKIYWDGADTPEPEGWIEPG